MAQFKTEDGKLMHRIIEEVSKFHRLSGTEENEKGFQKIIEFVKANGHTPEIQEFTCSDFPINIMFRINGLILAILYTLTWILILIESTLLILTFALLILIFSLLGEKISSFSFGKFIKLGKQLSCKNATWVIKPREEVKHKVIFGGHHDSKSQTFRVTIRAFIMIATTITMLYFSIQTIIHVIQSLYGISIPMPSIYSMIWTYFITLVILFNGYGNRSPGANDNLSAVACIITLANFFKLNPPNHTEIHFLINDAEEMGLFGAQYWLNSKKKQLDADNTYFVIYDTVGAMPIVNLASFGLPPHVLSSKFQTIIKKAQEQGKIPNLKKLYLPIGAATDHVIFDKSGFDTLVITSLCGRVHTKNDSIEYIKEEPLLLAKDTGIAVVEIIDNG